MDRLTQKLKKEKQVKDNENDKQTLFITDVKSIKENLKIKEILRNVKMNSSMRLKAPPGSKIMNSKDFNEEDCFEESSMNQNSSEPLSAVNPDVDITKTDLEDHVESEVNTNEHELTLDNLNIKKIEIEEASDFTPNETGPGLAPTEKRNSLINTQSDINDTNNNDVIDKLTASSSNGNLVEKNRDRKLSLDHTMLSRQDGFSQSELDLHTIGKSPLERKYSFFRKKLDSFVRNTTEMFRRQNSFLQHRGSMSCSLQSLNDNCNTSEVNETNCPPPQEQEPHGSRTSLQTPPFPIVRSTSSISSLSFMQSGNLPSSSSQTSLAGSQPALHGPNTADFEESYSNSNSVNSLNEFYLKEAMLNSRAISMSSGLDAPFRQQRRKASRMNRVSWIASEGIANYAKRKIQDEKNEMLTCHSYQDFSCIPENDLYSQNDNQGRRLSYQRAVSGEDPTPMQLKHQDSTSKKKYQFLDNGQARLEVAGILEEYTKDGVPTLQGFDLEPIPDESFVYLMWATNLQNFQEIYNLKEVSEKELIRQAAINELVHTEAEYLRHLMTMVESLEKITLDTSKLVDNLVVKKYYVSQKVYIGAAHGLQSEGKMLSIDTAKLFSNLPDVLNASLCFWNMAYMPMIKDAVENAIPFNMLYMVQGFSMFKEIFVPYEKFVVEQSKLQEYYRKKQQTEPEFATYLTWCTSHKDCNRLQLSDYLVKPMQRMTKYSLMLERILSDTEIVDEFLAVKSMIKLTRDNLIDLNRSVRQREELDKMDQLENAIEDFNIALKDDDVEKITKSFSKLNIRAPMLHCLPSHGRNVIHQGQLRFRDGAKEIDVRVMLLTDMLLVCRKLARGYAYQYKQIRPKYMIDKLVQIPKFVGKDKKDISSLLYIVTDDLGSACGSFCLTEMPKEDKPKDKLKTWLLKFKEAKLTYEIVSFMANFPGKEVDKLLVSYVAESLNSKTSHEDRIVEDAAYDRVAAMTHRSMGASNDQNTSQTSLKIKTFDGSPYMNDQILLGAFVRQPGRYRKCSIVHRTARIQKPDTPEEYEIPSIQPSTSSRSLVEQQPGPSRVVQRLSISPDRLLPPPPDTADGTSVTVRISESEYEMAMLQATPTLQPSPSKTSECSSGTQSTLRVQPQNVVELYSLPDLTIEPSTPRSTTSPTQPTASERLYQSHHEVLQRIRFVTTQTQQYLTPDSRGSSYPPPSPTRGSLKRSLAFSYTFKNPPLSKMGHVSSQTQLDTIQYSQPQDEPGSSPKPGPSEKSDKKSKLSSSRSTTREDEDSKSDPCHSRKVESPSPGRRDESPDQHKRGESTCSSYRDESPGTSYTDRSIRDRSTSPSHKEISYSPGQSQRDSFDRSSMEISPGTAYKSTGAIPRSVSRGFDRRSKVKKRRDKYRQESKESDSLKKEKSLSFSFKDESYDSSHRGSFSHSHRGSISPSQRGSITPSRRGSISPSQRGSITPSRRGSISPSQRGSFSPSHKDETYSGQKELSPVCGDSKTNYYPRQESSSLSQIEQSNPTEDEPSEKQKSPETRHIPETLDIQVEIIDPIYKAKPRSSSSSPISFDDDWLSFRESNPRTVKKKVIITEPIRAMLREELMASISTISEMTDTDYGGSIMSRRRFRWFIRRLRETTKKTKWNKMFKWCK